MKLWIEINSTYVGFKIVWITAVSKIYTHRNTQLINGKLLLRSGEKCMAMASIIIVGRWRTLCGRQANMFWVVPSCLGDRVTLLNFLQFVSHLQNTSNDLCDKGWRETWPGGAWRLPSCRCYDYDCSGRGRTEDRGQEENNADLAISQNRML